jgi:hypothetical protein
VKTSPRTTNWNGIARGVFKPKRRKIVRSGGIPPNEAHLDLIRSLECVLSEDPRHTCSRRIEAAHLGNRGRGQKAPDETAVPMCDSAHRTGQKALQKGEKTFFSYWVVRSKEVLISDYATLGLLTGTIKPDSLWMQKRDAEVSA